MSLGIPLLGGIWSAESYGPHTSFAKRKHRALILEEHYRLAAGPKRKLLMLPAAHKRVACGKVADIWRIEKPEFEFDSQHIGHTAVNDLHRDASLHDKLA